jgi:hypothetical protein
MADYEAIYNQAWTDSVWEFDGQPHVPDAEGHAAGIAAVVAAAKADALKDSIQYVDAVSFAHMTRAEVLSMLRTFAEWQASQ